MRRAGAVGRPAGIVAVAAAGLLLAAAPARADQEIVADTPNRYSTPSVTMDQGERLTFRNRDFARHDVTHAAGQPLFRSDLVGQGETSFVEGSQYLTTGTYDFLCSVHPEMTGRLTVTANGTPQERPGEGPGSASDDVDRQEPAVALELGRPRAAKLRRSRALRLLVGADEAARLRVVVRVGARRARPLRLALGSAGTRRVEVALPRRVRERLRRGRRLVVLVRAVDAAGNVGTDQRSRRLR